MKRIYIIGSYMIMVIIIITMCKTLKLNKNINIKLNKELGKKIYQVYGVDEIYSIENSEKIDKAIEGKFSKFNNFKNQLIIYNAYGTNKLSLNSYFYTNNECKIKYKISVEGVADFERDAYEDKEYLKKHNIQIIGLISGKVNKVTISSEDINGKINNYEFEINVPQFEIPQITKKYQSERENVSEGLYVLMGGLKNETGMVDDIFLADDDGNIRGIITTQKDIDANKKI